MLAFKEKHRFSKERLAAEIGVDRGTLDRLLKGGTCRDNTLRKIEQCVGVHFGPSAGTSELVDSADWICGKYLTYRYSFDHAEQSSVVCALGVIEPSLTGTGYAYLERQQNIAPTGECHSIEVEGEAKFFPSVDLLQIVAAPGVTRVISLKKGARFETEMRGLLLALNEIQDVGWYPVSSPILFRRQPSSVTQAQLMQHLGVLEAEHCNASIHAALAQAAAKFIAVPRGVTTGKNSKVPR